MLKWTAKRKEKESKKTSEATTQSKNVCTCLCSGRFCETALRSGIFCRKSILCQTQIMKIEYIDSERDRPTDRTQESSAVMSGLRHLWIIYFKFTHSIETKWAMMSYILASVWMKELEEREKSATSQPHKTTYETSYILLFLSKLQSKIE